MRQAKRVNTRTNKTRRQWTFELLEPRTVLSAGRIADLANVFANPHAKVLKTIGQPKAGPGMVFTPAGFSPAQMRQAYGFNNIVFPGNIKGDGKGTTIAIVDAFNNPSIVADLKAFDAQFGLPDPPNLKIVNQRGGSVLPAPDAGWAGEIALDVEWAHAIAPAANILLVEATTNAFFDLATAVLYARSAAGVVVVSNSYGGPEFLGEGFLDSYYTTPNGHPGVTFTVSAGDNGAPAEYPSSSPNVISVGGTALKLTSLNNWSGESVWATTDPRFGLSGGGGGASLYENPPAYQKALGLLSRGTPDISYNADPATGVAVFSTAAFGGWAVIGGTSAGAPQWAGLIAIADQGRQLANKNSLSNAQAVLYNLPKTDFHDITVGNNGVFPGVVGNQAGVGYDLASGLGTPIANLVIRDLVAFNGPIIAPSTPPPGSVNTGQFWFFVKPFASGGEGAGPASGAVAAAANMSGDAGSAGGDSGNSGEAKQTLADGAVDNSSLPPTLHPDDSLWSHNSDSEEGSLWSRRSRALHHASAAVSDAAIEMLFNKLDGAALAAG